MEMRLMKENIQMEQPVGRAEAHTLVEGDITLPGGLREEARVLHAGAMAVVEHTEAMQDRLSVMGKVMFHALYTQGDPTNVCVMEATADFAQHLDLPGLTPHHAAEASAFVEHVEASAYNGRLSMRANLALQGSAMAQQGIDMVTGITDVEGVQCRTRQMNIKRTVARGEGESFLREEFALPKGMEIRETLYATAYAALESTAGGLGRAGLAGKVQLEVCHTSAMPGKPVVITRHTLPFEQGVDLAGEDGDDLQGCVWVKDVAVASQDAGDGERTLRAEVLLGMTAWADRHEKVTVLDDAYTTCGDALCMKYADVPCRVEDRRASTAESGRAMLMLPENQPPVRSVLCAFATPVMTGREQLGGRLTVEGMLETTILYMTDDAEAPVAAQAAEPFRLTFAAQAGGQDCIRLHISDIEASAITSDRVEMKYIMHLALQGSDVETYRIVQDAAAEAAPPPDGSIVLYFVQPGETLWDIARRYRVPVEEIRRLNPEGTNEVRPGQGIVVWRRQPNL